MSTKHRYLVLIGDLEASRKMDAAEREAAQRKLQQAIEDIREMSTGYVSPPTITLGDEFQVVYERVHDLFLHLWRIQAALHPVRIRFGLGWGTISTQINPDQAIGMDGPAFHHARSALDSLKEEKGRFKIEGAEPDHPIIRLSNQSLDLISHEMLGWHQRRFEILWRLKMGEKYKEIAEELDISQSAFYKNVDAGALETIIAISDTIIEVIHENLEV